MRVVSLPEEMRKACDEARARGQRVALVPTMGALHEGHAALVREARKRADWVLVTVFVNPTQFGPSEDFARYPRSLEADVALAERNGAELVFAPAPEAIYLPGDETRVRVSETARALCGEFRPVHFEGVATVVAKLFALAGPCVALFGRKDYQQSRVITRMARDLFLPVEVVAVSTIREPDGVAMSSRNRYLSSADRERAKRIPEALSRAAGLFANGERRADVLRESARGHVEPAVDSIDYVELADADTVTPIASGATVGERVLLALAVKIGGARLIDNMVLGEDLAPLPVAAAQASTPGEAASS